MRTNPSEFVSSFNCSATSGSARSSSFILVPVWLNTPAIASVSTYTSASRPSSVIRLTKLLKASGALSRREIPAASLVSRSRSRRSFIAVSAARLSEAKNPMPPPDTAPTTKPCTAASPAPANGSCVGSAIWRIATFSAIFSTGLCTNSSALPSTALLPTCAVVLPGFPRMRPRYLPPIPDTSAFHIPDTLPDSLPTSLAIRLRAIVGS